MTVARNQQRDTWKSAAYRTAAPLDSIPACEAGTVDPFADIDPDRIPDRRLALLFACAHSAIDSSVHTPLMLQVVLGFEAAPIAAALGLPTTTLTKRLSRAKRRLREAGVPFQIPGRSAMATRLPVVLEAIYGCFAMSWADAGSNFRESTESLVGEARHLAVTLATLLEDEPEAWGLAALITFSLSRAESRGAGYVPLEEQDTASWDRSLIADAEAMLVKASTYRYLGRFQLEAAMQAVHADRRRAGVTDWNALATLSTALISIAPTLGALVSHAAIIARTAGPETALAQLEHLAARQTEVDRLQAFHATAAEMLMQIGDAARARAAYARAIDLSGDPRVREWLRKRVTHVDERGRASFDFDSSDRSDDE
ncbi:MAG TPA: RNA polymerase subunit sigma-70 [Candidatus Yaniella excrementigallinarum]|nr:RNA polymerase subunit sigma-70 [Candidatus Yaniella excrementigallinarum]